MTDHGSILLDVANLILSCKWVELTAAAPLDDSWLHAIKEDCLNHKPFHFNEIF